MPEGKPVFLLLDHHGAAGFEIDVTLDGSIIEFVPAELDTRRRVFALQYPLVSGKFGQTLHVKIAFLAANGMRDEHTYATRHGCRVFDRTDPK